MATPCAVIQKLDNGSFLMSSIRSDGFVSGVGAVLLKHYQDPEKIFHLMALGWVSPLEAEPESHLDGETFGGEYPKTFATEDDAVRFSLGEGMMFLWRDGAWWCGTPEEEFFEPITWTHTRLPTFVLLTREMILKQDPSRDDYLDGKVEPPIFKEWLSDKQAELAEQAKTDPNLKVFGEATKGIFGFSYKT